MIAAGCRRYFMVLLHRWQKEWKITCIIFHWTNTSGLQGSMFAIFSPHSVETVWWHGPYMTLSLPGKYNRTSEKSRDDGGVSTYSLWKVVMSHRNPSFEWPARRWSTSLFLFLAVQEALKTGITTTKKKRQRQQRRRTGRRRRRSQKKRRKKETINNWMSVLLKVSRLNVAPSSITWYCQRDWNHPRHHDHCPMHHLAWRRDAWNSTVSDTLPETNIAPANRSSLKEMAMLASGRVTYINVWGDLLWEFQLDMMIFRRRPVHCTWYLSITMRRGSFELKQRGLRVLRGLPVDVTSQPSAGLKISVALMRTTSAWNCISSNQRDSKVTLTKVTMDPSYQGMITQVYQTQLRLQQIR